MKILLVCLTLRAGGAENVITKLANHFASLKLHTKIITFAERNEEPFYRLSQEVELEQLDYIKKDNLSFLNKSLIFLFGYKKLRQVFNDFKPDVVISFLTSANLITLMAGINSKIPIIVSERVDPYSHRINIFKRILRKFLYNRAHAVVVQNSTVAKFFAKYNEKLLIIPNPVDMPNVLWQGKALNNNKVHIVHVGRLSMEKGQEILFKAAQLLINEFDVTISLYGDGSDKAYLTKLAQELKLIDKIIFYGNVNNIFEHLLQGDLFVFPSRYEGFPNALAEAMSLGMPVIATACCGSRDLIQHEVNGLLVQIDDYNALAKAIKRMVENENLRQMLAQQARAIINTYEAKKVYKIWESLIKRTY